MVIVETLETIPITNDFNWPSPNFKTLDKNFHGNIFNILLWVL